MFPQLPLMDSILLEGLTCKASELIEMGKSVLNDDDNNPFPVFSDKEPKHETTKSPELKWESQSEGIQSKEYTEFHFNFPATERDLHSGNSCFKKTKRGSFLLKLRSISHFPEMSEEEGHEFFELLLKITAKQEASMGSFGFQLLYVLLPLFTSEPKAKQTSPVLQHFKYSSENIRRMLLPEIIKNPKTKKLGLEYALFMLNNFENAHVFHFTRDSETIESLNWMDKRKKKAKNENDSKRKIALAVTVRELQETSLVLKKKVEELEKGVKKLDISSRLTQSVGFQNSLNSTRRTEEKEKVIEMESSITQLRGKISEMEQSLTPFAKFDRGEQAELKNGSSGFNESLFRTTNHSKFESVFWEIHEETQSKMVEMGKENRKENQKTVNLIRYSYKMLSVLD